VQVKQSPLVAPVQVEQLGSQAAKIREKCDDQSRGHRKGERITLTHALGDIGIGGGTVGLTTSLIKHQPRIAGQAIIGGDTSAAETTNRAS